MESLVDRISRRPQISAPRRFVEPRPLEYREHFRPGMGTENVGPLLRSLIQMLRPNRVLEIGAGYTTPFLLEGLVNNRRYYDDGCLSERFLENTNYDPRLVIIDDMSLGELQKQNGLTDIIKSQYVEIVEGRFQGLAEQLNQNYGNFDFVWYDCGGYEEYVHFIEEYWSICSDYVLFHFTYTDGRPNKLLSAILENIPKDTYSRFDIIEPHKRRQGSITMIRKTPLS